MNDEFGVVLYRLIEDWGGLFQGACFTEDQYKRVYFSDRCLFEPIYQHERLHLLVYEDEELCRANGIECILFWTPKEMEKFMEKLSNARQRN